MQSKYRTNADNGNLNVMDEPAIEMSPFEDLEDDDDKDSDKIAYGGLGTYCYPDDPALAEVQRKLNSQLLEKIKQIQRLHEEELRYSKKLAKETAESSKTLYEMQMRVRSDQKMIKKKERELKTIQEEVSSLDNKLKEQKEEVEAELIRYRMAIEELSTDMGIGNENEFLEFLNKQDQSFRENERNTYMAVSKLKEKVSMLSDRKRSQTERLCLIYERQEKLGYLLNEYERLQVHEESLDSYAAGQAENARQENEALGADIDQIQSLRSSAATWYSRKSIDLFSVEDTDGGLSLEISKLEDALKRSRRKSMHETTISRELAASIEIVETSAMKIVPKINALSEQKSEYARHLITAANQSKQITEEEKHISMVITEMENSVERLSSSNHRLEQSCEIMENEIEALLKDLAGSVTRMEKLAKKLESTSSKDNRKHIVAAKKERWQVANNLRLASETCTAYDNELKQIICRLNDIKEQVQKEDDNLTSTARRYETMHSKWHRLQANIADIENSPKITMRENFETNALIVKREQLTEAMTRRHVEEKMLLDLDEQLIKIKRQCRALKLDVDGKRFRLKDNTEQVTANAADLKLKQDELQKAKAQLKARRDALRYMDAEYNKISGAVDKSEQMLTEKDQGYFGNAMKRAQEIGQLRKWIDDTDDKIKDLQLALQYGKDEAENWKSKQNYLNKAKDDLVNNINGEIKYLTSCTRVMQSKRRKLLKRKTGLECLIGNVFGRRLDKLTYHHTHMSYTPWVESMLNVDCTRLTKIRDQLLIQRQRYTEKISQLVQFHEGQIEESEMLNYKHTQLKQSQRLVYSWLFELPQYMYPAAYKLAMRIEKVYTAAEDPQDAHIYTILSKDETARRLKAITLYRMLYVLMHFQDSYEAVDMNSVIFTMEHLIRHDVDSAELHRKYVMKAVIPVPSPIKKVTIHESGSKKAEREDDDSSCSDSKVDDEYNDMDSKSPGMDAGRKDPPYDDDDMDYKSEFVYSRAIHDGDDQDAEERGEAVRDKDAGDKDISDVGNVAMRPSMDREMGVWKANDLDCHHYADFLAAKSEAARTGKVQRFSGKDGEKSSYWFFS